MRIRRFTLLVTCVILGGSWCAIAEEEGVQRQFFESKVRPLLVDHCQSCHSDDDPQSKLSVDSLEGLLRGGTRGPAILPGKPAESLLISAVKHGEVLKMPPKEKLSASQIADLVRWIETGAYWPDAKPVTVASTKPAFQEPALTAEQREFWAFQKPSRSKIPEAKWQGDFRSPIDRFLDEKLAQAGYTPTAPADQRVMLRRVTFDLIGLPPTPEELDDFLSDAAPDALDRGVDRLLASPRYGEKWGRNWLDVARYGDSNGLDENLAYANAFRYRDWVVSAWNRDLPYDEFVREQLAGDLLPPTTDEQETLQRIVATGFLSIGAKMLAEDDPVKMQMDIIDEQVDTVGKAFLGMTFGCARCHHHKFDPISMHDYYGLAGIFKSTHTMDTFTVVAKWHERQLASPEKLEQWNAQKNALTAKQDEIQKLITAKNDQLVAAARKHVGDYLLAVAQQEYRDRFLAERQPLGNQPEQWKSAEAFVVEAESFARGNVLKDVSNYGQGIGVLVNKGEKPNFVEYDVELPSAGNYQIELRYAAAESRPCRLIVNGRELKADAAAKVTGGWFPPDQAWHVEGVYDLPAGKVMIRLEHPSMFPHIDQLLLAPVANVPVPESFVRLDASYIPVPKLVSQWQAYLAKPAAETDQGFSAWREANRNYQQSSTEQTFAALTIAAKDLQQQADQVLSTASPEDSLFKLLMDPNGPFAAPKDWESDYPAETITALKQLREEKKSLENALPVYPEAMSVADQTTEDLRIHYRGSHLTLGDVVPRRFPKVMGGENAVVGSQGSGRLELSYWLTQPDHPLTSRVMVNRLWMWHFGQGLVRSVDNFGLLGEPPTHPELLDWLATEMPRKSWSLKSMHREMMGSAAYRRAGQVDDAQRMNDPEDRFWGRFPRRRLTVEELRDAILFTSGTLDERFGSNLLTTPNRQYVTSTANVNPDMYRSPRRTIYLPVVRSALFDVFSAFDFADPNVSSGQRQSTTVAAQALFLMNSEFVSKQTHFWAESLLSDSSLDENSRIVTAFRRALQREPTDVEVKRVTEFLHDALRNKAENTTPEVNRRNAWQSFCRALVSTNEFVFVE